jgi:hypothetical protein
MVMRLTVIKISLIFLFASILAGCKKNYIVSDKQVILFQMEYINYAWDYQHRGYFIDNEGNILTYDNPQEWNFPDNGSVISQDKLFENLSKCTISERIIPREELEKFSKHIRNIASSKVSAPKNVGADMGSITYNCYQFDEGSLTYKSFLIKMEGDNTCENLNFFSKKVASWMKEINGNIFMK